LHKKEKPQLLSLLFSAFWQSWLASALLIAYVRFYVLVEPEYRLTRFAVYEDWAVIALVCVTAIAFVFLVLRRLKRK